VSSGSENVYPKAWQQAEDAALESDVLLSIGTSSLVRPASKLPDIALVHGAKIVQIKSRSNTIRCKGPLQLSSKAGEILPT